MSDMTEALVNQSAQLVERLERRYAEIVVRKNKAHRSMTTMNAAIEGRRLRLAKMLSDAQRRMTRRVAKLNNAW